MEFWWKKAGSGVDICFVRSEGHLIPASYAGPGELSDVGQASRGPMFRPSATFGLQTGGVPIPRGRADQLHSAASRYPQAEVSHRSYEDPRC